MINKQVIFILLLAGVLMWGGYQLIPAWTEFQDTRRELAHLESQMLDTQAQNEQIRGEIHRLRNDDRAIERVAREKFGWARPSETIYDFSPPVSGQSSSAQRP